jgi:hypothetical protein
MPGYLVDEGGERTHAVLPIDEYERLKSAEEKLESVRGYAMEMISAMGYEDPGQTGETAGQEHDAAGEHHQEHHEERSWYQRT